jgi:hypothetical protein
LFVGLLLLELVEVWDGGLRTIKILRYLQQMDRSMFEEKGGGNFVCAPKKKEAKF